MLNCDRARIADFTEQLDRSYAGPAARYARQQQARAPDPPAAPLEPGVDDPDVNLVFTEATAALASLGIKPRDATNLVRKVLQSVPQPHTVQALVTAALQARK